MNTSKSPLTIVHIAYAAASKALPLYTSKFSKRTFTLPQLTSILVLKEFLGKDFRGIAAIAAEWSDVQRVLELTTAPHFTTLQKAEAALFKQKTFRKLMQSILSIAKVSKVQSNVTQLAAVDSTGLDAHHVSHYFVTRRHFAIQGLQKAQYRKYPKANIVCNTSNHLILSGIAERGPAFDAQHLAQLLKQTTRLTFVKTLVADAGYDSEASHVLLREDYGIRSIIKPKDW